MTEAAPPTEPKTFTLFGTEQVQLDRFQEQLYTMTENASRNALSGFFQKNYEPLHRFLLQLYITSLTSYHPTRDRTEKNLEEERFTVSEHQMLACWADLLTPSPTQNPFDAPIHVLELDDLRALEDPDTPMLLDDLLQQSTTDDTTTPGGAEVGEGSPILSPVSGVAPPSLSMDSESTDEPGRGGSKKKKRKGKNSTTDEIESLRRQLAETKRNQESKSKPRHHVWGSVSSSGSISSIDARYNSARPRSRGHGSFQSFSGLSQMATKLAAQRGGFNPALAVALSGKHGTILIKGSAASSDEKDQNEPHRRRVSSKRDSIWEGVLDINNVIMAPETPKWRPRMSFEESASMEEGLFEAILKILSPQSYVNTNAPSLFEEIEITSTGTFCLFLPLLAVITTKIGRDKSMQKRLMSAVTGRVKKEPDLKQTLSFLLNSYRDSEEITKLYKKSKIFQRSDKTIVHLDEIEPLKPPITPQKSADRGASPSPQSSSSHKAPPQIIQDRPESAIAFFAALLKRGYSVGTEIKLHPNSQIRDPVSVSAPPVSRVEIRKIIQSNTKPLLVDVYVAGRDNFEYLSSTCILKMGDDLRKDAAVLQVFRLMNKIWREKGLNYQDCPVQALTYQCIAMGPDFGALELVPGCKPLRMVGEIEESITIAQIFNLVATAVGSYIASYVMGIRDRHFDNVLIRVSDCTLFHIDFGYVLGDEVSIDTSKFAITQGLQQLMGNYWNEFVQLGVTAMLALRERHQELIKFARIAFDYLAPGDQVQQFLKKQLHVDDMSEAEVAKYIAKKLKDSPASKRTKWKNVVHQVATALPKKS